MLRLKVAHASMQFSDSKAQQAHDVRVVFNRGYDIITGTESGPDNALHDLVGRTAPGFGYRLSHYRAQWVAVSEKIIEGGWRRGYVPVIESYEGVGRHPDRGICWAAWNSGGYGRITWGTGHYLTKGAHHDDPNYALNSRYTRAIGDWGKRRGSGTALVGYNGDQNIDDEPDDTFRGKPFTSVWDELGKHPPTHGSRTIDVISTYDKDKRVKVKSARSLGDRKVFLHTDHRLIEAIIEVRPKR